MKVRSIIFPTRYDYEDVFRALLLGVEEAVARTRKNWKAASTDMAQYREENFLSLADSYINFYKNNLI